MVSGGAAPHRARKGASKGLAMVIHSLLNLSPVYTDMPTSWKLITLHTYGSYIFLYVLHLHKNFTEKERKSTSLHSSPYSHPWAFIILLLLHMTVTRWLFWSFEIKILQSLHCLFSVAGKWDKAHWTSKPPVSLEPSVEVKAQSRLVREDTRTLSVNFMSHPALDFPMHLKFLGHNRNVVTLHGMKSSLSLARNHSLFILIKLHSYFWLQIASQQGKILLALAIICLGSVCFLIQNEIRNLIYSTKSDYLLCSKR